MQRQVVIHSPQKHGQSEFGIMTRRWLGLFIYGWGPRQHSLDSMMDITIAHLLQRLKQHRFSLWLGSLLLMVSLFCSVSMAATINDLYQTHVDGKQPPAVWQQQAMRAVLVKLVGDPAFLQSDAMKAELKRSRDYIQQFEQVQWHGEPMLKVSLDEVKITQLLQQQQIKMWGAQRPDVLVWLVEKTGDTPQFIVSSDHPLRQALQREAAHYGLSLQFPLYDVEEQTLLNAEAAWQSDANAIHSVSGRYQSPEVILLKLDVTQNNQGISQFRLISQQLALPSNDSSVSSPSAPTFTGNQQWVAEDNLGLATPFAQALLKQLAAKYAVQLAIQGTALQRVELKIEGLQSLSDVVQLERMLTAMLTVKQLKLQAFNHNTAYYAVDLTASAADFTNALALERRLQAVTTADEQPAATTEIDAVDELGAEEAALESMLSGEASSAASTLTTENSQSLLMPHAASSALHYRYLGQ